MHGITIRAKIITLALSVIYGLLPVLLHAADNPPPVAVLLSDNDSVYNEPVEAFRAEIDSPVSLFNLQGDIKKDPLLKEKLLSIHPRLIFALGAKAAFTAKLWTREYQEIPVLFAMVLNWKRYNLLDQKNMAGIAAEIAPGTKFANITILSPGIKRIGVIYSSYSRETLQRAKEAAEIFNIELYGKEIDRPTDFKLHFKKIRRKIDAFFVLNDPVLYTLDNMDWLNTRCIKGKLPCIGQSKNIAEHGLVLSINPDISDIGSQAASMAKNIINRHQRPDLIGVMAPLGTQIIINQTTAQRIGLKLRQASLDMATQIID
ncbi:MAG: ABC transporter substrate binding protein [Candidatus Electrothrix sp. GW3-4]|uniref:ABC transporter substrate-binding protein n=1 Tax=Candidatus Electrothrix sp. GW3-4 TaxID=3126740 RepID=UPI0030CF45C3